MSTNYYYVVRQPFEGATLWQGPHLGKVSYLGGERGCKFIWAVEPADALRVLAEHADAPMVTDEYGRILSGTEFLEVVNGCAVYDVDSIGQEFS